MQCEIDPTAVARRIRTQMQRYDVLIPRLAKVAGVAQPRVEELVFGRGRVGPMILMAIAPALRCTADWLLNGEVAR